MRDLGERDRRWDSRVLKLLTVFEVRSLMDKSIGSKKDGGFSR